MDNQAISAMQTRLERLEARNRLLAYALLGLLGVCTLLVILSAATPSALPEVQEVVRAKAFELVDANGEVRAELSADPDGSAGLWFYDAGGEISSVLGTSSDGSTELVLFDASGNVRAMLITLADGSAGLWFYDAGGEIRAVLGTRPDGTPLLDLLDASGEFLFSAP